MGVRLWARAWPFVGIVGSCGELPNASSEELPDLLLNGEVEFMILKPYIFHACYRFVLAELRDLRLTCHRLRIRSGDDHN